MIILPAFDHIDPAPQNDFWHPRTHLIRLRMTGP